MSTPAIVQAEPGLRLEHYGPRGSIAVVGWRISAEPGTPAEMVLAAPLPAGVIWILRDRDGRKVASEPVDFE